MDGVGAGIFGVVSVLVIADLTRGTGRFNLTLGAITTAVGIGAALSQVIAGSIVHHIGFAPASSFLRGWRPQRWLFSICSCPRRATHDWQQSDRHSGHQALVLENLAVRQQLAVYKRHSKRPPLSGSDRMFWIALAHTAPLSRALGPAKEKIVRSTPSRRIWCGAIGS
jgi:MFS family permease